MIAQLLNKTQKKKANSKWLSLSKKLGILFILIVISGVALALHSKGQSDTCIGQKCSKTIPVTVIDHTDVITQEKTPTEYVIDEEHLSDQEQENERLIIQRDIGNAISLVFEKPFNYREGFNCLLKVSKGNVTIDNCDDNAVYERAVSLALKNSKIGKIKPERIKEDFYLNIRF